MDTPPPLGVSSHAAPSVYTAGPGAPPRGAPWNTSLGIISLVLACLGLLLSALQLVNLLMMKSFAKTAAAFPTTSTVTITTTAGGPTTTSTVAVVNAASAFQMSESTSKLVFAGELANILAMALLAVAGIQLLRRRKNGRGLHLLWAVLKFPVQILLAIAAYTMTRQMFENMGNQSGVPSGMATPMAITSAGFGMLFGLAYPIFLLIALNTRKVRSSIEAASNASPA